MATQTKSNTGTIVQVIGPVVDVDVTGDAKMPPLLTAPEADKVLSG